VESKSIIALLEELEAAIESVEFTLNGEEAPAGIGHKDVHGVGVEDVLGEVANRANGMIERVASLRSRAQGIMSRLV
jgi:hypothetical protein